MIRELHGALCSSRTASSSASLEQPVRRVLEFLEAKSPLEESLENGGLEAAQSAPRPAVEHAPGVDAASQYVRELFILCQVCAVAHASLCSSLNRQWHAFGGLAILYVPLLCGYSVAASSECPTDRARTVFKYPYFPCYVLGCPIQTSAETLAIRGIHALAMGA